MYIHIYVIYIYIYTIISNYKKLELKCVYIRQVYAIKISNLHFCVISVVKSHLRRYRYIRFLEKYYCLIIKYKIDIKFWHSDEYIVII